MPCVRSSKQRWDQLSAMRSKWQKSKEECMNRTITRISRAQWGLPIQISHHQRIESRHSKPNNWNISEAPSMKSKYMMQNSSSKERSKKEAKGSWQLILALSMTSLPVWETTKAYLPKLALKSHLQHKKNLDKQRVQHTSLLSLLSLAVQSISQQVISQQLTALQASPTTSHTIHRMRFTSRSWRESGSITRTSSYKTREEMRRLRRSWENGELQEAAWSLKFKEEKSTKTMQQTLKKREAS